MDLSTEERFEVLLESDQNDPEIQYALALCYYNGEGTAQDAREAMKWLQRAAEQGYPDAVAMLQHIDPPYSSNTEQQKPKEALTDATLPQWCQRAEEGEAEAQFRVAQWFVNSQTPNSAADIERYLQMAVAQGHPQACLLLGQRCLTDGRVLDALELLRNAADCGIAEAMHLLGICYSGTYGCTPQADQAERYLTQWANHAGADAMLELAFLYTTGSGLPQSAAKGMSWIAKAERAGRQDARQCLENRIAALHAKMEEKRRAEEIEQQKAAEQQAAAVAEQRRRVEEQARIQRANAEAAAQREEELCGYRQWCRIILGHLFGYWLLLLSIFPLFRTLYGYFFEKEMETIQKMLLGIRNLLMLCTGEGIGMFFYENSLVILIVPTLALYAWLVLQGSSQNTLPFTAKGFRLIAPSTVIALIAILSSIFTPASSFFLQVLYIFVLCAVNCAAVHYGMRKAVTISWKVLNSISNVLASLIYGGVSQFASMKK